MGIFRDKVVIEQHHHSHRGQPYAQSVTINEHRAPTDDSIRLAKEYEEKAWNRVANRVIEELPTIEAKVAVCEEDYGMRGKHLLFSVNGRPVKLFLEESRASNKDALVREVAETISKEILIQLFGMKRL